MKIEKSILWSIVLLFAASFMATVANAQEEPSGKESACFDSDIKIVDNLPKKPTSKTEQHIIDKIIHFVTHDYETQQSAFLDLDHNHDCKLEKSEVSQMLRDAHIGGIVRVFATTRLIDRYDISTDGAIEWPEFHFAIDKALKKQAERDSE